MTICTFRDDGQSRFRICPDLENVPTVNHINFMINGR